MCAKSVKVRIFMLLLIMLLTLNWSNKIVQATPVGHPEGFRLPFNTQLLAGGYTNVSQGPRCGTGAYYDNPPQSHHHGYFPNAPHVTTEALDFTLPYGHDVLAPKSGYAYSNTISGALTVLIVHDNGTYKSVVTHLSQVLITGQGVWVEQGDVVGKVGNSGGVPTHLHFVVLANFPNGSLQEKQNINGESMPIWGLPGIVWKDDINPTGYPYNVNSSCDENIDYAATAQYPPPNLCSGWNPGVSEGWGPHPHEVLFTNVYLNHGGQSTVGCSTNAARWEQGIFWQDFDGGSYGHCGIFLSENQSNAYLVCDPYLGALYNTPNWHTEIGVPQSNKVSATPYDIFTGNLIPFKFGNIYHLSFDQNAYVVRGKSA